MTGTVTCSEPTATDTSTNTDHSDTHTTARTQEYDDGTSIDATVSAAVSGAGLELRLSNPGGNNTIEATNSGSVTAGAGFNALQLTGNGGQITYGGAGNVTGIGSGNGLHITNTGAGAISVSDGGALSGQIGLFASSVAGDITIDGSGTVSGSSIAIEAFSNSGDVLIKGVTATGAIVVGNTTGTVGITATSSTGTYTTSSNASVTVIAPGGTITAIGTDGVSVSNTGSGFIKVGNTQAITNNTPGVDGVHTSAEAGDTTITVGADITGGGNGIDASSTSGDITIDGSGTITGGSIGIWARSNSGNILIEDVTTDSIIAGDTTGWIGITADAGAIATSGLASVTVIAAGGTIDAIGTDGVAVSNADARDILVRNTQSIDNGVGDGIKTTINGLNATGETTIEVGANVTGAANGITAKSWIGKVEVTVDHAATVKGEGGAGVNIDTEGGNASVTGDGTGKVTGASNGIQANTSGAGTAGTVLVQGLADVQGDGGNGIDVNAGQHGGALTVNGIARIEGSEEGIHASVDGDISLQGSGRGPANDGVNGGITGEGGTGIDAYSANGSIDIGGSTGNGAIAGDADGILAALGLSSLGSVTISSNGNIIGHGGAGVAASGTAGAVTVKGNGDITGGGTGSADAGVRASTNGNGSVTVSDNGNILGGGDGIAANSAGSGDISVQGNTSVTGQSGNGIIAVTNSGNVHIGDSDANGAVVGALSGIVGSVELGSGTTTIVTTATVTGQGGAGIAAMTAAGKITISAGDDVTGRVYGVNARSTAGAIDLALNGDVTGTIGNGVDIQSGSGNVSIANAAKVSGGSRAINGTSGGLFDIANTGTVQGLVQVTAGAGSQFDNTGGTWNAFGGSSSYNRNFLAGAGSAINMVNAATADIVSIGGTYTGVAGSLLAIDLDVATGHADRLATGDAVGTTTLNFNRVTDGFIAAPIVVVSQTADTDKTESFVRGLGLDSAGIVSYSLGKEGSDWVVSSTLDQSRAASIVTNTAVALSTLASGFFERASKSVTYRKGERDDVACSLWFHADTGRYDIDAASQLTANGQRSLGSFESRQRLNYSGGQVGFDCANLNIGGSGWSGHAGVTGGKIDGDVTQLDGAGRSDIDMPFVGGYAFLTNGALTFDASLRRDFNELKLTNPYAGLQKTDVDGNATSIAGSMVYRAALGGGLSVSPSAGISYTRYELDSFRILSGTLPGGVSAGNDESLTGNLGVEVSFAQQIAPGSFVVPYASVSAWRNFKDETDLALTFDDIGGGATHISSETKGPSSFGQFTGGVSYTNITLGLSAYVQGTWRDGADISGGSITGGGRLDF